MMPIELTSTSASTTVSWSTKLTRLQPPCPYSPAPTQVLSDPPPAPCTLVVCGEAPGKDEDEQGRVFVGKSGQLLREILQKENVLEQTHLTNVSAWRPPRNVGTKGDERPGLAVIRSQLPRLLFELAVASPKAIVALGQSACAGLLPGEPFHRGAVESLRVVGRDVPVFITWHPAYVFREPKVYSDIVRDIQRAVNMEVPREADGSHVLIEAGDPAPDFVGRYVVLDIESTRADSSADVVCVAAKDEERTFLFTSASLPVLRESVERFKGRFVAHNAKFDQTLLRRAGVPVTIHHDSMLLHLALDNRRGTHSLKTLAPVYGQRKTLENTVIGTLKEGAENVWEDTPFNLLYNYCAADAVATWDVFSRLAAITDMREKRLYHFLRRVARPLALGEERGICVDTEALQAAKAEYGKKVQALHNAFDFDPDSPKQTVEGLRLAGYQVDSSSEPVLRRLRGDLPAKLLEYREESKVLKAFLEPLEVWSVAGPDGHVSCHPQVLIHGTDTGRTSCENPNLQQIPVGLRYIFTPRPRHLFLGWDLVSNEVRCIAVLSGDQRLIDILRAGTDVHQMIADEIGVERKTAKNFLFGTVYGAGLQKLADTAQVDFETVKRGVEKIKELFPGLMSWKERVMEEVWAQGYVETPFGRRIAFPYCDNQTTWRVERQAINSLPQSLGSDIGLISLIRAYEILGHVPLAFVHDSVLLEVPEASAHRSVRELKDVLDDLYPNEHGVRFEVEMKVGENWRDMEPV